MKYLTVLSILSIETFSEEVNFKAHKSFLVAQRAGGGGVEVNKVVSGVRWTDGGQNAEVEAEVEAEEEEETEAEKKLGVYHPDT